MKIGKAVRVAWMVAALLSSAKLGCAQDEPMGDAARKARSEKSQASHASKVVTDDDLGPQLTPVSETDDPGQVLKRAERAWLTDMPRTCRESASNNSGPGSSSETLREIAAPDRGHIEITQRGGMDPGRTELITIGNDMYSRKGTGAWRKDSAEGNPYGPVMLNRLPEELTSDWGSGLKLIRRDTVGGALTFQYEVKFHPGGVDTRNRTIDFWVGAKDNLLRKLETVNTELPPIVGGATFRNTMTCSYGPVPEVKPPI